MSGVAGLLMLPNRQRFEVQALPLPLVVFFQLTELAGCRSLLDAGWRM